MERSGVVLRFDLVSILPRIVGHLFLRRFHPVRLALVPAPVLSVKRKGQKVFIESRLWVMSKTSNFALWERGSRFDMAPAANASLG